MINCTNYFFITWTFIVYLLGFSLHIKAAQGNTSDSLLLSYRASATQTNDLIHTKLDLIPNFKTQHIAGKAWITLKAHFYETQQLELDAQGMDIHQVQLLHQTKLQQLNYTYDQKVLRIVLPRVFLRTESYTVYIEYTAKPNERKTSGSAAITSDKGFYFINPMGIEQNKPTQIWTQGQTQANSVWFPTIDRPNQKTTQELLVTVPQKFTTLSNGLLSKQTNKDSVRTDYWVMDKPHAPYLFFLGVGEYAVIKDRYKNIELSYFVEPAYASVAHRIFGETPRMMKIYEDLLGFPFAWSKYAQIVGRDYVSGAMENTTATLHMESAQQNARQLKDGNGWEHVIAHELFHHWFGNLVTAESWGNLTMNESFANYGEYLWLEKRYGKTEAEAHREKELSSYYASKNKHHTSLVRFYYANQEDMFDVISYNKGGAILHMLRNYVGDDAFFAALKLYLERFQFKTTEAHDLRKVFEEVTGQDLNWFFNQWYFSDGHPQIDIRYHYDDNKKQTLVYIHQLEKIYTLPCKVSIHFYGGRVITKSFFLNKSSDTFSIQYDVQGKRPLWIAIDADQVWIAEKTNHQTLPVWLYQLEHGAYKDRSEAIDFLKTFLHSNRSVKKAFFTLLTQADYHTKINVLEALREIKTDSLKNNDWKILEVLADNKHHQEHPFVQAIAIELIADAPKGKKYVTLFRSHLYDSSYSVAGACLAGLYKFDRDSTLRRHVPTLKQDAKGKLKEELFHILCDNPTTENIRFIADGYATENLQIQAYFSLCMTSYLMQEDADIELGKKIIDGLYAFYTNIPKAYNFLRNIIDGLKEQNSMKATKPALRGALLHYFRLKFNL